MTSITSEDLDASMYAKIPLLGRLVNSQLGRYDGFFFTGRLRLPSGREKKTIISPTLRNYYIYLIFRYLFYYLIQKDKINKNRNKDKYWSSKINPGGSRFQDRYKPGTPMLEPGICFREHSTIPESGPDGSKSLKFKTARI